MRYLLVLTLFLPFYGLSYSIKRYTHFTKKNLNNEMEIVGISPDGKYGKLLILSSITTAFFYEVDLFQKPDELYLLNDYNYLIISETEFLESTTEYKLKLYYKGLLVDSLAAQEKLKETFKNTNDPRLYYSSSAGTAELKWFGKQLTIDSLTNKFNLITSETADFTHMYSLYELDEKVPADDALTLDGQPFQTWMIQHNIFEEETSLFIKITVIDGKATCTIQGPFNNQKMPDKKVEELQRLIEQTVISDSFYLDRTHSWYFEKYVVFNEQKE